MARRVAERGVELWRFHAGLLEFTRESSTPRVGFFDKLRELEVGHRLLLANTSGLFGQQFDQLVLRSFLSLRHKEPK